MENLKEYLADHKISQSAFARMMNVSQPTVWHWLNGTKCPRRAKLIEIADATKLSVDELLDR
jgi:transcriptional regulator with XRE-family HTH domain